MQYNYRDMWVISDRTQQFRGIGSIIGGGIGVMWGNREKKAYNKEKRNERGNVQNTLRA